MGDAVCVAYVHSDEVAHSWHLSLIELVGWDFAHHGRVVRGGWLAMSYAASGGLVAARSDTIRQFLADRDADWLFWVDTDMGIAPDTIDSLLEVADPVERPIVGGLCFAQKDTDSDGLGGYRTEPRVTIFDWVQDGQGRGTFMGRTRYPVNAVVQCAGTGSACILIHRSVLEKMAAEFGPAWYERIPNPITGGMFGEDLSFCMRAQALGIPLFVHTGVKTSHLKHQWLQEQDYWAYAVAPPATEPTAVLVPAIRHTNAERFMTSLRASTSLARAYAIANADEEDAIAAWKAAGAEVLVGGTCRTFAERINLGYQLTAEPWMLVVGDDVRFHAGWLDHAQAMGGDRFHVVGTNDLANPRVTSGHHATHMLVRRSYVDETGSSWDGPGVVAHEGYRHWFVDDEIVTAAKQRGVWSMALGSRVEHLHPLFGKGEQDAVYELGQSHVDHDAALFNARLAEYLGGGS